VKIARGNKDKEATCQNIEQNAMIDLVAIRLILNRIAPA
jgi:hypothetical protein